MRNKRPIQLYCLLVCFMIGILIDVYILHRQVLLGKPKMQIILMGLPSVALLCMSFLLFIRQKGSYIAIWILYIPIAVCGWITAIVSLFLADMYVVLLLPICGILTLYSLFCEPLRKYFFTKS